MDTFMDFIDDGPLMFFGGMGMVVMILFALGEAIAVCKIFKQADVPAREFLIPIYNLIIPIHSHPNRWILVFFIPFVNFVVCTEVNEDLVKNFGKDIGFALGMICLSFIFFSILAFGRVN